jgi:hypothetical protein
MDAHPTSHPIERDPNTARDCLLLSRSKLIASLPGFLANRTERRETPPRSVTPWRQGSPRPGPLGLIASARLRPAPLPP